MGTPLQTQGWEKPLIMGTAGVQMWKLRTRIEGTPQSKNPEQRLMETLTIGTAGVQIPAHRWWEPFKMGTAGMQTREIRAVMMEPLILGTAGMQTREIREGIVEPLKMGTAVITHIQNHTMKDSVVFN